MLFVQIVFPLKGQITYSLFAPAVQIHSYHMSVFLYIHLNSRAKKIGILTPVFVGVSLQT